MESNRGASPEPPDNMTEPARRNEVMKARPVFPGAAGAELVLVIVLMETVLG